MEIPELNTSVFIIPSFSVENGQDRLVVLNQQAKTIIERMQGKHTRYVFVYPYRKTFRPITTMHTSAWKRARQKVGLPHVRIHDLKHAFGRRLRTAGVSFEDRQDLLGHKSSSVTTHYSAVEVRHLIDEANKVCIEGQSTPTLTVLRTKMQTPTISPPRSRGKFRVVR